MSDELEALVERTKLGDRQAAEALLGAVQHDLFRLALRMLGTQAEAEDATQEILLQALTHLSEFRGQSAFRTWLWRIGVRQLLRAKRSRREQLASFETLEQLIAQGAHSPASPEVTDAERALMAQEVRLACTQGVLLSLERDQRMSFRATKPPRCSRSTPPRTANVCRARVNVSRRGCARTAAWPMVRTRVVARARSRSLPRLASSI